MIVSSRTGIPMERIRLVQSDTDLVRSGGGTGGSRSLQLGGSAVLNATDAMVDKARHLAAHLLEANVDDIVVDTDAGTVGVAGVPASALDWGALAAAAADAPEGVIDTADGTLGLAAQLDFDQGEATFPFGAHIAVVEVDSETGKVTLLRHVAVDDCGTVLNPLLVEGQQHGGVAAGVSQALYEQVGFDEIGNPITGNFADYAIPSAAEFPFFEVHSTETPTPLNPLGAKGIGEASTIGSTPAVQNAVIDALSHLGVRHLDLPCTSESVWQAHRRRPPRRPARPVARAAGDLRPARRRPGGRRGRPQRRRRHLTLPRPCGQAARTVQAARSWVSKNAAWSVITLWVWPNSSKLTRPNSVAQAARPRTSTSSGTSRPASARSRAMSARTGRGSAAGDDLIVPAATPSATTAKKASGAIPAGSIVSPGAA